MSSQNLDDLTPSYIRDRALSKDEELDALVKRLENVSLQVGVPSRTVLVGAGVHNRQLGRRQIAVGMLTRQPSHRGHDVLIPALRCATALRNRPAHRLSDARREHVVVQELVDDRRSRTDVS